MPKYSKKLQVNIVQIIENEAQMVMYIVDL